MISARTHKKGDDKYASMSKRCFCLYKPQRHRGALLRLAAATCCCHTRCAAVSRGDPARCSSAGTNAAAGMRKQRNAGGGGCPDSNNNRVESVDLRPSRMNARCRDDDSTRLLWVTLLFRFKKKVWCACHPELPVAARDGRACGPQTRARAVLRRDAAAAGKRILIDSIDGHSMVWDCGRSCPRFRKRGHGQEESEAHQSRPLGH
jgi:hypothetical protein